MAEPKAGGQPRTAGRSSRWPWLPFVVLSLLMALVPGFGVGAVMLTAGGSDGFGSSWYAAARQAHGHAQLMGWGGGMILGVGLHFLPRLRGSPPHTSRWLPLWFWLFAVGLSLRVLVPLLGLPSTLLGVGQGLETAGVVGVLGLLVAALRNGPPLEQKKAFAEMLPLLAVAGGSLLLALAMWTIGAFRGGAGEGDAPLMHPLFDRVAVDAAAFGFVVALSLAMSARLFPLFFRVQLARSRGLRTAAWLLGVGIACDALAPLTGAPAWLAGIAALMEAAGIGVGIYAVRVFERRQVFPGDRGRYALRRDAPGLAVISAYAWVLVAGLLRLVQGLSALGVTEAVPFLSGVSRVPAHDLAWHAVGAGFMTMLILGVGYVLLPGFGGAKAVPPGWAWASLWLGNAAVVLRILPGLGAGLGWRALSAQAPMLFGLAGLCGLAAVFALGLSLALIWRRAATAAR